MPDGLLWGSGHVRRPEVRETHGCPAPRSLDLVPTTPPDAYAVFRPRRGAAVARISALACVGVFVVVAAVVPGGGGAGFAISDRVLTVLFGLAIAAVLWRYAVLRAVPTPAGLRVVNLVHTRDLQWQEIVQVGFVDGAPWVTLELSDTEEVSVMAIQRADGELAVQEAARLSALVSHHSCDPAP